MIHREAATEYHARKAFSASFAWRWVTTCPAQAWYESVFNPDAPPSKTGTEFDIGTATHLLTLEGKDFAARASLIPHETYHTKEARELRAQCYADNRTPLRPKDYRLVTALHDALRASAAAELLFSDGESEVTYTWEWEGIPCKARVDRLLKHPARGIDLKTAASASPETFQRAIVSDGHHLRHAFYQDGWNEWSDRPMLDYLYVVIAKEPPHLVSVNRVAPRSLEWGQKLYRKALYEFRRCQELGVFPGYDREPVNVVEMPAWAENLLGAQERAGEFDVEF